MKKLTFAVKKLSVAVKMLTFAMKKLSFAVKKLTFAMHLWANVGLRCTFIYFAIMHDHMSALSFLKCKLSLFSVSESLFTVR